MSCRHSRGILKSIRWSVLKSRFRSEVPTFSMRGSTSRQVATTHLPDSALVSARICTMPTVLCASPEYIKSHGSPRSMQELHQHMCLQLVTPHFPVDRWKFEGRDCGAEIDLRPGKLRVNSADALAVALVEGFGIGPLPMLSALSALESARWCVCCRSTSCRVQPCTPLICRENIWTQKSKHGLLFYASL